MENLKYQYYLNTWGGFYNDMSKLTPYGIERDGAFFFDSEEERTGYMNRLKEVGEKINNYNLVFDTSEGYTCNTINTLHRVVEYKGKRYYSQWTLSPNYPMHVAEYTMQWKWYPGFNDYPLGEDFDDYNNLTIVQEWITGAFTTTLNNEKLND